MTTKLTRRHMLASTIGALATGATAPVWAAEPLSPGEHRRIPLGDPGSGPWADRIIYQTSFEEDEAIWMEDPEAHPDTYSYDTAVSRTGSRSLRYDRTDGTYRTIGHHLPGTPGRYYTASVWIRCDELSQNSDGDPETRFGGMLALEAFEADSDGGSWISTAASGRFIRTGEWINFFVTYQAPFAAGGKSDTGTVRVGLYLRTGVYAGTVWFDDLTVVEHAPRVITTSLVTPTFRGQLIPRDHEEIHTRTAVDLTYVNPRDYAVRTELISADGQVISASDAAVAETVEFRYQALDLAPGNYLVRTEMLELATSTVVDAEEWAIEKLTAAPATYVDRHRRLIRDGQPHFPLGFFSSGGDNQRSIGNLAGSPFDTLLPYDVPDLADMNCAAENGIDIIYAVNAFFHDSLGASKPDEIEAVDDEVPAITATVEQFRDHPALLGWYLEDEPRIEQALERLVAHRNAIRDADPDHITYLVDNKAVTPGADYIRTADVFGIDSYPIGDPNVELWEPTELAEIALDEIPGRAMWNVPQSYPWTSRGGHFPTPQEFRNITWQMVIGGATGLIWYNIFQMGRGTDPDADNYNVYDPAVFEETFAIATETGAEVKALIPVLLSIDEPVTYESPAEEWLRTLAKSGGGEDYLFTVNNRDEVHEATFGVPSAISVEVIGENRTITPDADGSFTDRFAALDVHLYHLARPTTASLEALTREITLLSGVSNAPQLADNLSEILTQIGSALSAGDEVRAGRSVERYQRTISRWTGRAYTDDESARLIRLSEHLIR